MEKFGFSGLWKHIGSTVLAAALPVADAVVSYLNVVQLPAWAHGVVAIAAAVLAFYRGKVVPPVQALPPAA